MKFEVEFLDIPDIKEFEVTSPAVFVPGVRISYSAIKERLFQEGGLFDPAVFGKAVVCNCEEEPRVEVGLCDRCKTFVWDPSDEPLWFYKLPLSILRPNLAKTNMIRLLEDWDVDHKNHTGNSLSPVDFGTIEELLAYKSYLVYGSENEWELIKYDYRNPLDDPTEKVTTFEASRSLAGYKAVEWLYGKVVADALSTDKIYIPHPDRRKITAAYGKLFLDSKTQAAQSMIETCNKIKEMTDYGSDSVLDMVSGNRTYRAVTEYLNEVRLLLFTSKTSELAKYALGRPCSRAIRATITNRYDLNEDIVLVPYCMFETILPEIFELAEGDPVRINKILIDQNVKLLINRQPTISELSIMGMKPRVAELYPMKLFKHNIGVGEPDVFQVSRVSQMFKDELEARNKLDSDREERGVSPKFKTIREEVLFMNSRDEWGELGEDRRQQWRGSERVVCRKWATEWASAMSLNPVVMDGFSGDFDGDVLLCIGLKSDEAQAEAESMLPSSNFMESSTGKVRNGPIEEVVFTDY